MDRNNAIDIDPPILAKLTFDSSVSVDMQIVIQAEFDKWQSNPDVQDSLQKTLRESATKCLTGRS